MQQKKLIAVIVSLAFFFAGFAQSDSGSHCNRRISLLTCTPGSELYSTFGHSAFRIVDSLAGTDIIYNYGTFDFDDPHFYSKFVRGKLLYFVSVDEFQNFLAEYQYEKRGITEQSLNLSCEEKQKLIGALQENAKEENKYYKYDFVRDNCTTRLRDMIFSLANGKVSTKEIRPARNVTFRDLIHEYLDNGHEYWSKLGIDILLGAPVDKHISSNEAMFLPDYLLKAFDSTAIGGKKLVEEKSVILKAGSATEKKPFFTPFVVFFLLFIIIAALSFSGRAEKFLLFFDILIFFLSGLIGGLILFMWFGTDHQTCKNNFNLAWAFPFNLIAAFFIPGRRNRARIYFLAYAILEIFLLVSWKWLPQEMNDALLPVIAILLIRSIVIYKRAPDGK